MTEFDKEIVRAAQAVARCYERGTKNYFDATSYDIALRDLVAAVAAKREHERPKLMTAEEACRQWFARPHEAYAGTRCEREMHAVLTEERRRTLAVAVGAINNLPSHHHPRDSADTATVSKLGAINALTAALQPKS